MILHFKRLYHSAILWSWIFNAFRVLSGLVVLPVLLRVLTKSDLGMHYVLLSLSALGPLMDFGFLNAIDRAISYAMGGAIELKSFGMATVPEKRDGPNFFLLWKLLYTTRILYQLLSAVLLLFLGAGGTYLVYTKVHETSVPSVTWWAWSFCLAGTVFELYSNWWNIYLRGMNEVLQSLRILVVSYFLRILLSFGFLFSGFGLLSLPLASIFSSVCTQLLSRRCVLRILAQNSCSRPTRSEVLALVRTLWPNSWRVGVQFFSTYLTTSAAAFICLHYFGLTTNAEYGLSSQLINFVSGMAMVWVSVKWPLICQLRARHELARLEEVFRPRILLQQLSFFLISVIVLPLAPYLLQWIGSGKSVLPLPWLFLMATTLFLDIHFRAWCSLIATENRLPYLWAIVISNVLGFILGVLLIKFCSLGVGALILGPFVVGCCVNFWYWPLKGANSLKTTWLRFTFNRPKPNDSLSKEGFRIIARS